MFLTEDLAKEELVEVPLRRAKEAEDLELPRYMTPGASGLDLCAAVDEDLLLAPGARALVPTGLFVAVPEGFELQIRPRSGLALKNGLTVLNAPGTIDADYRGEIKIILINLGEAPYSVKRGERIAQMVLCPVAKLKFVLTENLPVTKRGAGGFGHT